MESKAKQGMTEIQCTKKANDEGNFVQVKMFRVDSNISGTMKFNTEMQIVVYVCWDTIC